MNPEKQQSYSYYKFRNCPEAKFRQNFQNMKVHVKPQNRNIVYRYLNSQKIMLHLFSKFGPKQKKYTYQQKKSIYEDLSQGRSSVPKKNWQSIIQSQKQVNNKTQTMLFVNDSYKNKNQEKLRYNTEPTPKRYKIKKADKNDRTNYSISSAKTHKTNISQKQDMNQTMTAFNKTLRKFHDKVKYKQKGLKIIKRYNTLQNQFIEKIPRDIGQQTRQSLQENQIIIKLCRQQQTIEDKNEDYRKQGQKLKRYKQPLISDTIRDQFRRQIKQRKIEAQKTIRQELKNNKKGILQNFKFKKREH